MEGASLGGVSDGSVSGMVFSCCGWFLLKRMASARLRAMTLARAPRVIAIWLKTRHHPTAKLPLSPIIEFLFSLLLRRPL